MHLPPSLRAIIALLILIAASLSSHTASSQEPTTGRQNLLPNGTFEKGLEGWTIQSFHKNGTATVDETEKRDGKPTVKLVNAKGDDSMISCKITVKPQTRYRLTGYIKTKDVIPDEKKGTAGASIGLRGGFEHTQFILKTKPWSKVSIDFETGNKTEIELAGRLGHYSAKVAGTVWFADLRVEELGKARK